MYLLDRIDLRSSLEVDLEEYGKDASSIERCVMSTAG